MKRTILITISLLALAGLLLVAMQCDGGAAPTPTKPAATTVPGATQPPAQPTTPSGGAYPAGATATPVPPAATEEPGSYPPASPPDAEKLLNERCTQCHNLDRVTSAKKSQEEWQKTVDDMVSKGAKLTPEEADVLVRFLAKVYY